jgi:hypothetical protein
LGKLLKNGHAVDKPKPWMTINVFGRPSTAFDIPSLFAWQLRVQIGDATRRKLATSMCRVALNDVIPSGKAMALVRQGQ